MKQPATPLRTLLSSGEGVTLGGSLINLALSLVKAAAGVLGNSSALVADAVHSLSDLVSDILVLFGYRMGRMPEDADHPYGHGKVETLATAMLGSILLAVGAAIGIDAALLLLRREPLPTPGLLALGAAALSIAVKETLYRWTARVARDTDSALLLANAWHHRSDALSSVGALVGVAGARLGWAWMDPVAALLVSVCVLKIGWELLWQALWDLVDSSVDEPLVAEIGAEIDRVAGVVSHHDLRARRLGKDILVDVDVAVDPELNVIQGHEVARLVRSRLLARIRNLRDAMVHVEPVGARDGLYASAQRGEVVAAAEAVARDHAGVLGLHGTRIVPLPGGYLINLDVEVSPALSVREAHAIAHQIKVRVRELPGISDAVIHVDLHGE